MRRRPRRLKVYVFRSVRNAAVDELRRGQMTEMLNESFIFDRQAEPDEAAIRSEFQGHVAEALLSLSQDERESVVQHLYCDLTFREIAQLRGVSINTVSSWYYRGLNRLRGLLEA